MLVDLTNILDELASKSRGDLRFHSFLAYNRVKIITESLGEALRNVGLVVEDKFSRKMVYKGAGLLAVNTLEDIRSVVNKLKHSRKGLNILEVAPKLEVFNERIKLVIGFLNLYKKILKNEKTYANLYFTLQVITRDLKTILRRHEQLLNKALKLKETAKPAS